MINLLFIIDKTYVEHLKVTLYSIKQVMKDREIGFISYRKRLSTKILIWNSTVTRWGLIINRLLFLKTCLSMRRQLSVILILFIIAYWHMSFCQQRS